MQSKDTWSPLEDIPHGNILACREDDHIPGYNQWNRDSNFSYNAVRGIVNNWKEMNHTHFSQIRNQPMDKMKLVIVQKMKYNIKQDLLYHKKSVWWAYTDPIPLSCTTHSVLLSLIRRIWFMMQCPVLNHRITEWMTQTSLYTQNNSLLV